MTRDANYDHQRSIGTMRMMHLRLMVADPSMAALVSATWIELLIGDCTDHHDIAEKHASFLSARDSLVRVEEHNHDSLHCLEPHLADCPRMGNHPHLNQRWMHVEQDMICPN